MRQLMRIEACQRKPLIAASRGTGLGSVGRHEGGTRQQRLPMGGERDQIVAVGAISMTQHDQMRGFALARRQAALAAGGRLVSDRAARSYWVVEDTEGNRSCICTAADR